jgi:aryl-alcohol dehydrogenase-like predicted oxidoreductase
MSKIVLGTVQFGLKYGINNQFGVPNDNEITSIFNEAYKSGISILDSASSYGDAEIKISKLSKVSFEIISKFPQISSEDVFFDILFNSLNNLKIDYLHGFLAHNANSIIENPSIWKYLEKAKNKKYVKKIGYSLYTIEQLEKLLELNFYPDIVQLPYSLLDRKFEQYFSFLREKSVEIHVRSVFLQGLYFRQTNNLPANLVKLTKPLNQIDELCEKYKLNKAALALNFAVQNKSIDKVVIGVDKLVQLKENIDMVNIWNYNDNIFDEIKSIIVENPELLNPNNWK